jgi:hypothetical protein
LIEQMGDHLFTPHPATGADGGANIAQVKRQHLVLAGRRARYGGKPFSLRFSRVEEPVWSRESMRADDSDRAVLGRSWTTEVVVGLAANKLCQFWARLLVCGRSACAPLKSLYQAEAAATAPAGKPVAEDRLWSPDVLALIAPAIAGTISRKAIYHCLGGNGSGGFAPWGGQSF